MKVLQVLMFFAWAAAAWADPVVLVNTLADRPVFNYASAAGVETRTIAPGNRAVLEAGQFSGLGLKRVALAGGRTYYLANFGARPGLWVLEADQALVLNQAGVPVAVTLASQTPVTGTLAQGALALVGPGADGTLSLTFDGGSGGLVTRPLEGGRVYRLELVSPEGLGTEVGLTVWD